MDDIVISGDDLDEINRVKAFLDSNFRIMDLGNLRFFLGLEVARSTEGIIINQRKYALEILSDSGMLSCKPSSTPMDSSNKLCQAKDSSEILSDAQPYRHLVGRLLYLTTIRPDLSFVVHQLSQFVSAPTTSHMNAAHRVLRYLKASPAQGLFFPSNNELQLSGFTDSDWACCPDTRRSITSLCVFLGNSLVSWRLKKQTTVPRSSTEAEYRALASMSCEIQWLTYLLTDLRVPCSKPAYVFCDNVSAIYLAKNPAFHERSKHIEINCHITRERINDGTLHLLPVRSSSQLADIFTKPLPSQPFHLIISKLGLRDVLRPACGGVLGVNTVDNVEKGILTEQKKKITTCS
ncbi:uncharacterized mitochondrial protein AtMg00810-like [Gastrolobium bilobum]|uniref:uncharacterized mitochondrial protein AtMg00810-like n=1 Tax=Gastrolobium bilobum TaxID=150636 RepID=UPI002AB19E98|nr:uncharacterized mitochondrial protein AtMg00810-like [Gastrolobium bilobum]